MKCIYNHVTNPVNVIGRVSFDDINGLTIVSPDSKGKIIILAASFRKHVVNFGVYEFNGDIKLSRNGSFYIFTPNEYVFLDDEFENRIPAEYVYGGKIRLFFTDNTSQLLKASNLQEALNLSNKSHLYDFYQSE